MLLKNYFSLFRTSLVGIIILIPSCTFKSTEDDQFQNGNLVEQKKSLDFEISEADLKKDIETWLHL